MSNFVTKTDFEDFKKEFSFALQKFMGKARAESDDDESSANHGNGDDHSIISG